MSSLCIDRLYIIRVFHVINELSEYVMFEQDTASHDIGNQVWILKQQIDSLQHELGKLHRQMGGNVVRQSSSYPEVKKRSEQTRLRILVTGGTGFVGSHLVDKLMKEGHEVIALDNYFTGRKKNVEHWIGHPNFELVHHDVVNPYYIEGEWCLTCSQNTI